MSPNDDDDIGAANHSTDVTSDYSELISDRVSTEMEVKQEEVHRSARLTATCNVKSGRMIIPNDRGNIFIASPNLMFVNTLCLLF